MKDKNYWAIIMVWLVLLLTQVNTYFMNKRISSLEEKVELIEKSIKEQASSQEEINSFNQKFYQDQLYFNTYIYQTLIVNRGKPL